jgi:hypothetical protein
MEGRSILSAKCYTLAAKVIHRQGDHLHALARVGIDLI